MRKTGTIFVVGLLLVSFTMAGGIVTNTNQSADFMRLLNRNASTDIDAVYFNPAGLTSLNDGLHLYLSSQTIYQDRTVMSDLPSLHSDTFNGETFAPVFPNFYIAYKTGDLAVGAGFVPIGGGGTAVFDDGLPSFEGPMSLLPTLLTANGIPTTDYSLNVSFDGSSTYLGGQAVVSYKINDYISVAGGARYFMATNTYKGHLKDVMINPNSAMFGLDGSMISAPTAFTQISGGLATFAGYASGGAASLQPYLAQAGAYTFEQLLAAQMIDQATVTATITGLSQLGIPIDETWTLQQAYDAAQATAASLTAQSAAMASYADLTGDKEVDVKQTGSGFAPIFGLYLTPMEGFDIGIRYEGKAAMTLTNETKDGMDGGFEQYADGVESGADMPAMLGFGVSFKAMPCLRLVSDINYYFNKDVDWSGREEYLVGGMEIGAGLDFALNEQILLSAGFLRTVNSGALKRYHSDVSHSFTSSTIGIGGRYYVNDNLYVVLGLSNTFYDDLYNSGVSYQGLAIANETYDKNTIDVAIGIGFSK